MQNDIYLVFEEIAEEKELSNCVTEASQKNKQYRGFYNRKIKFIN